MNFFKRDFNEYPEYCFSQKFVSFDRFIESDCPDKSEIKESITF